MLSQNTSCQSIILTQLFLAKNSPQKKKTFLWWRISPQNVFFFFQRHEFRHKYHTFPSDFIFIATCHTFPSEFIYFRHNMLPFAGNIVFPAKKTITFIGDMAFATKYGPFFDDSFFFFLISKYCAFHDKLISPQNVSFCWRHYFCCK